MSDQPPINEDLGLAARLRAQGIATDNVGDIAIASSLDLYGIILVLLRRLGGMAVITDDEMDETDDDEMEQTEAEVDGRAAIKLQLKRTTEGP